MRALEFIKNSWGRLVFVSLALAFFFLEVFSYEPSLAFLRLRQASQLLWQGQNPYSGVIVEGSFVLSPTAALFVYAPFAWLPEALSQVFFQLLTWALLSFSLFKYFSYFTVDVEVREFLCALASAFLFLYSYEHPHAFHISSAFLLSLAWLVSRRHVSWALFLLALVSNVFVFPALAAVLFLWTRFLAQKSIAWVGAYVLFGIVLSLLPWLFLPQTLSLEIHRYWWAGIEMLSAQFQTGAADYTLVVSACVVFYISFWALRFKGHSGLGNRIPESLLTRSLLLSAMLLPLLWPSSNFAAPVMLLALAVDFGRQLKYFSGTRQLRIMKIVFSIMGVLLSLLALVSGGLIYLGLFALLYLILDALLLFNGAETSPAKST